MAGVAAVEDAGDGLEGVVLAARGIADGHDEDVRSLSVRGLHLASEQDAGESERGAQREDGLVADGGVVDIVHDVFDEPAGMMKVLGEIVHSF